LTRGDHDYRFLAMDRLAMVRAERRRQATEELEAERDRADSLREEIARLIVELEGPRLDEEAFAQLAPEDVEVVRSALQGDTAIEGDDPDWLDSDDPWRDEETARADVESEIARLEEEIAVSTRRQEAFERYLAALGE
jgi:hypothetical protein